MFPHSSAFLICLACLMAVRVCRPNAKYLGCYRDEENNPDFSEKEPHNSAMTLQYCIERCSHKNYRYAGIKAGIICSCGNSYGKHKKSEQKCSIKCLGNNDIGCGGTQANSVYDVTIKVPSAPAGLFCVNRNENFLILKWNPPLFANGELIKYKLKVVKMEAFSKKDNSHFIFEKEYSNETLEALVNKLSSTTKYNVSVSAATSDGYGNETSRMIWTAVSTPEKVPKITLLNRYRHSMEIRLHTLNISTHPVKFYEIVVCPVPYYPFNLTTNVSTQPNTSCYLSNIISPFFFKRHKVIDIGVGESTPPATNLPLSPYVDYEIYSGIVYEHNNQSTFLYGLQLLHEEEADELNVEPQTVIHTVVSSLMFALIIIMSGGIVVFILVRKYFAQKFYKNNNKRGSEQKVVSDAFSSAKKISYICPIPDDSETNTSKGPSNSVKEALRQLPMLASSNVMYDTLVGMGKFGSYYSATFSKEMSISYPILILKVDSSINQNDEAFLRELKVYAKLSVHQCVPSLSGVFENFNFKEVSLTFQYNVNHISLQEYLEQVKKSKEFSPQPLLSCSRKIAEVLKHFESLNFPYKNLSTRNILISSNTVSPILTQFSLIEFDVFTEKSKSSSLLEIKDITLELRAPEFIDSEECSIKSTVWSFGLLFWQILSLGAIPPISKDTQNILPQPFSLKSLDMYMFLLKMCDRSPQNRPNFEQIHKYLESSSKTPSIYLCFDEEVMKKMEK